MKGREWDMDASVKQPLPGKPGYFVLRLLELTQGVPVSSGLHHAFENWRKPFNPILGETWQASLSDGTTMFMEQISHHPPVSAFHMEGPGARGNRLVPILMISSSSDILYLPVYLRVANNS